MNWLQKISAPIRTEDLPEILTKSLEYEIGGEWIADKPNPWTEELEKITGDRRLSENVGYSTNFWITCRTGDGQFNQKWGVSVNFTVTSGSSSTIFDSETGDWDFSIDALVQWASPNSWTTAHPYPLLVRASGRRSNMKTIQEFANFVKATIKEDQTDENDENDGFYGGAEPEFDPDPDSGVKNPVTQV